LLCRGFESYQSLDCLPSTHVVRDEAASGLERVSYSCALEVLQFTFDAGDVKLGVERAAGLDHAAGVP
jgi:hypothetical protein